MDFGIKAIFGGDTSQLKASLQDANSQLKGFKNQAESLGLDMGKIALSTVFIAGARAIGEMIDNAQKLRDEMAKNGKTFDMQTAILANYGDAWDWVKSRVSDATKFIVSSVGYTGATLREMFVGGNKWVDLYYQNMAAQSDVTTAKVLDNIKKSADSYQERLGKSIEAVKKAEEEYAEKGMSNLQAQAAQLNKISALEEDQAKYRVASLAWNEAEAKLLKEKAKLKELEMKQVEEFTKKQEDSAKESRKLEDEYRKATKLTQKENEEYIKLMMKSSVGLTDEEAARLKVLQAQIKQKEIQYDIDQIISKGIDNISKEEMEILKTKYKQREEQEKIINLKTQTVPIIKEELSWEEKITKEIRAQADAAAAAKRITISNTGNDYASQSTANLEYVLRNLQNDFAKSNAAFGTQAFGLTNPAAPAYQLQIEAVNKELSKRREAQQLINLYGEDKARARYSLGPDAFDRVLSYLQGGDAKKTQSIVDQLAKIREELKGKFRNT